MPDRLMRRGSVYYFRARYPADLRHLFRAAERWKSLRTSDFREAKRRLAVESVRFDAEMAERRKNLSAPLKATLTPAEVDKIASGYFHELMSEDEDHRSIGLSDREYRVSGESIDVSSVAARHALARGDVSGFEGEFDDWLTSNGYHLLPRSEAHRIALNRMLREFVRFLDAAEKRQQGDPIDTPAPPKAEDVGPTVRELIDAYINDPTTHRTAKTVATYRIIFDALAELVGEDRPAREVTRADCERIRDVLRRLPSNARKKYPGVPLATAVELGAKDGAPTLSAGTVNAYLENLSALFKWGVKNWRVDRNPAEGLSVHDPVPARAKRRPFPLEALPAIFSTPLYTGCQDDEGGYARPGPNRPRRGRFWVPLLSLFHGIRMSEACQLHTSDVRRMGQTWVLILTDETEEGTDAADMKRIKTAAGHRFVPLHAELERIGFLEFVERQRKAGSVRLFPDIQRSADGYYSSFSKWFARFIEKAGVKEKRVTFHSFRHSYRDALRRAKAPRDFVIALGGWAGQGTDDNYGLEGLSPDDLAEYVAKVAYPGLDLRHLYLSS